MFVTQGVVFIFFFNWRLAAAASMHFHFHVFVIYFQPFCTLYAGDRRTDLSTVLPLDSDSPGMDSTISLLGSEHRRTVKPKFIQLNSRAGTGWGYDTFFGVDIHFGSVCITVHVCENCALIFKYFNDYYHEKKCVGELE